MPTNEIQFLARFFRTLGDETRLQLIIILSEGEFATADLATTLDLSSTELADHISQLRQIGLINLNTSGVQHTYTLNRPALDRYLQHIFDLARLRESLLAPPENDTAWVDGLVLDDYAKDVLRNYTWNGRLTQIPFKQKKLAAVMQWVAGLFEVGVSYPEWEVNEIVKQVHEDYATLRRNLIRFGHMAREGGGGHYWLLVNPAEEERHAS